MHLDDALARVAEIHAQVLRAEVYRGYRALPMAVCGGIALVAALALDLSGAPVDPSEFARTWLGVAGLCTLVCGLDLVRQHRHEDNRVLLRRTIPVLMQSVPSLALGALFSFLWIGGDNAVWLPALWCGLFGLCALSARPFLPRAVGIVAAWYLACGFYLALQVGSSVSAPSPWVMGIPFGFGQCLLAVVLWRNLERRSPALLEERQ